MELEGMGSDSAGAGNAATDSTLEPEMGERATGDASRGFRQNRASSRALARWGSGLARASSSAARRVSKLFTKRRAISVVEISNGFLKLAEVEKTEGRNWGARIAIRKIPPDRTELPETISRLFAELGMNRDNVIAVFPRSKALIRYVSLPSSDENEIRRMLDFQLGRLIPFDKEDAVTDFKITRVSEDGSAEVMLLAVKKQLIVDYLDLLSKAGVEPNAIRLDAECMSDFYEMSRSAGSVIDGETVSIVDLDVDSTMIGIVKHGNLVFSRSLPVGTATLLREEQADPAELQRFLSDLRDSLVSYSRKGNGDDVSRIVVMGTGADSEGLLKEIERQLGIPVESLSHFVKGLLAVESGIYEGTRLTSVSAVVGAAIERRTRRIDLSPDALKMERARELVMNQRVGLGLLAVCVLLMFSAVFSQRIHLKQSYLRELDSQVDSLRPVAEEIEAIQEKAVIIQDHLDAAGVYLDVLAELYRACPPGVRLNLLNSDENRSVTIKGMAGSMSEVLELVPKLEAAPLLKNTTVKYVNQRSIGEGRLVDFQLSFEVSKDERNPKQTVK
ncbi:MAG: pilus assembly protein PilM [Candidatus Eisenbacteria bacterium]